MDIDVVGSSENDMRLVECIVDEGLGSRGYIRGQLNDLEEWDKGRIGGSGNVFIEIGNLYDEGDEGDGLLEKVQEYICKDGIIGEKVVEMGDVIGIKDISVLVGGEQEKEEEMVNVNIDV